MRFLAFLSLPLLAAAAVAGDPGERAKAAAHAAREYRRAHEQAIVDELLALVAIPNVASDHENVERNAAAIVSMFARRGVPARLLRVEDAPPLVVADWLSPGATETIAFYAHYDGQPADPAKWSTPPWQPVVREERVWGRSTSDDKAPIVAMLAAIDALRAARVVPTVNVRFVLEGEEEAGSPHLAAYFERYRKAVVPDAWLICDGPVHQSRSMQLYFGARGVVGLEITTYGATRALHSGHYGNWAPNPIVVLTHLIDEMRDTEARILIPGFYDDVAPISPGEREALAAMPSIEADLGRELALGRTEGAGRSLGEQILAPAMNLRGIEAGRVGAAAANAIPSEARASVDFRLVPKQTPSRVREEVERFVSERGFFVVHEAPAAATLAAHANVVRLDWEAGYPASRTPLDAPFAKRVFAAVSAGMGTPPLRAPSLGGSVPMFLFADGGRIPVVGVPIVNHDNNQHAANENLRLENLRHGIEVFAALFAGI